jgi:hypothetical protein
MINSTDDSYAFYGYNTSVGIPGYIIDFERKEFHNYDANNFGENVTFTYLHSRKYNKDLYCSEEKKVHYDFSNQKTDSLKTKLVLIKNRISKKGKSKFIGKADLEYDETDFVFSSKLLKLIGHYFFDNRDVSFIGNKLPTKITYNYNNGFALILDLTKKLKINTLLSLSKEQIQYKQ